MKRRSFVAAVSVLATGVLAGCFGSSDGGEMSTEVPDVELEQGEETTITVTASNIGMLVFSRTTPNPYPPVEGEGVAVNVSEATVSPRPDSGAETQPPYWYWESPTSVEVDVPVFATDDAEPGNYEYGIVVAPDDDRDSESTSEEATITVHES